MKNQKKSFFSVAIFEKVKEVIFGNAFSYFLKRGVFGVAIFKNFKRQKKGVFGAAFLKKRLSNSNGLFQM